MTLHLIKLAVGIDDIESLIRRQKQYLLSNGNARMRTRMMPKRTDELLSGGSLYWVIRRAIQVRQTIRAVREDRDRDGKSMCVVELDPKAVPVSPYPFRPFQGWRYLKPEAAPPDEKTGSVYVDPKMPAPMRIELRRLGLL